MQVYFEDITEGMDVPPLVRGPLGTSEIVRYSSTVENFEPIHHDPDWCRKAGLPHILLAAPFKQAMLISLMRQWIGPAGFVRQLRCSHRAMDHPGCTLTASGRVVRKWLENGLGYVECEVQLTNDRGQVTCPGEVVAVVPLKGQGPVRKVYNPPAEAYAWAFQDAPPRG